MKSLHWIIFALGVWVIASPFLYDDLLTLFLGDIFVPSDLIELIRWDDLFVGATIFVLALIVASLEQTVEKHPGLKAMHWMQVALAGWTAIAPFALSFSLEGYTWSHAVCGGFIAIFALLQIRYEHIKKR